MKNCGEYIEKNILNLFILFLVILNFLAIIAPIASSLGLTFISEPIYFIYSFTCHQFHWRSIHIFDHQIAWCTRDTFIWLSFLVTALGFKYNYLKKGIAWYWIVPFMVPIAIDGGFQTISTLIGVSTENHIYLSTNLLRMVTGSIFGMGLGLVITPFLKEEQDFANSSSPLQGGARRGNQRIEPLKVISIFIILFIIYLSLVFIWDKTSNEYIPVNTLDHAVKQGPDDINDWVEQRRLND